jgi:hypothetical protein
MADHAACARMAGECSLSSFLIKTRWNQSQSGAGRKAALALIVLLVAAERLTGRRRYAQNFRQCRSRLARLLAAAIVWREKHANAESDKNQGPPRSYQLNQVDIKGAQVDRQCHDADDDQHDCAKISLHGFLSDKY